MKHHLLALTLLFATTAIASPPLSSAMQRVCDRVTAVAFKPEAPRVVLPNDELLATIAKTADASKIQEALRTESLDAHRGRSGTTALIYAVSMSNWVAATALLESGADINGRSKSGETPLERAIGQNKPSIACQLLARGAAIPPATEEFAYLLPAAALADREDDAVALVSYLLEAGYPIDAVLPPANETALHVAAQTGKVELTRYLLEHHANASLRSGNGETASIAAKRAGHTRIVRLLNRLPEASR